MQAGERREFQFGAVVHLSTANEAANFSANSIQRYHSLGWSFKYAVLLFELFLYLGCHLHVFSSVISDFLYLEGETETRLCADAARGAARP